MGTVTRGFLRAVAAAAAALCALAPLSGAAAAHPAPPRAQATSALAQAVGAREERPSVLGAQSASSDLAVAVSSLNPRVITSEEELLVAGTVTNTTNSPLSEVSLTITVGTTTPVSVAALTNALSEDAGSSEVYATSLGAIAVGASAAFEVRVPTSSLPLGTASGWGPRVLTATASSGGATGSDNAILIWDSGETVAASRVNTLVPWTSDAASQGPREREAVLAIAGRTGATLAVDPLLIPRGGQPTEAPPQGDTDEEDPESGQSGQSGQSAQTAPTPTPSASASPTPTPSPTPTDPVENTRYRANQSFTASLLRTAPELVALPAGDADLGALALAGDAGLQTKALQSIASFPSTPRKAGWVVPTPAPSTSPSAPANPSAPTAPSPSPSGSAGPSAPASSAPTPSTGATETPGAQAGETGIDAAEADEGPTIHTDVVWPSDTAFGTTQLSSYPGRLTIAPVGSLMPSDDVPFTSVARVRVDPSTGETIGVIPTTTVDGADVLSQQGDIAALLGWDSQSEADQLDAEQAITAITAIITRERPYSSRTLFTAAPRGTAVNASLTGKLDALLTSRWVEPVSFGDMAASEATDLERQTVGAGSLAPGTEAAVASLTQALTDLAPLAKATEEPDEVFAQVEPFLLPSISAGLSPDSQLGAASRYTAQVAGLLASIAVEPSDAVNLINKSAAFPVRIRNSLPWNVHVDVTLIPDDPRLQATPATNQIVTANSATTVEVPVSAIGSGNIQVKYHVTTPSGAVLDNKQSVRVRMRAGWEDAFTVVVASLFGLLFAMGVVRSLRRRRARAALAGTGTAAAEPGREEHGSDAHGPADHGPSGQSADGGTPVASADDRTGPTGTAPAGEEHGTPLAATDPGSATSAEHDTEEKEQT
ncbi:hypothetical protein EHS14_09645 [Schaalia georgiae]|nr:hypothetical protein EHS14_09645 [Schaalia georgiae]